MCAHVGTGFSWRRRADAGVLAGDAERPLPRDEDAEELRVMRGQPMPSLEELQRPGGPAGVRGHHRQRGAHGGAHGGAAPAAPDHDRDRCVLLVRACFRGLP